MGLSRSMQLLLLVMLLLVLGAISMLTFTNYGWSFLDYAGMEDITVEKAEFIGLDALGQAVMKVEWDSRPLGTSEYYNLYFQGTETRWRVGAYSFEPVYITFPTEKGAYVFAEAETYTPQDRAFVQVERNPRGTLSNALTVSFPNSDSLTTVTPQQLGYDSYPVPNITETSLFSELDENGNYQVLYRWNDQLNYNEKLWLWGKVGSDGEWQFYGEWAENSTVMHYPWEDNLLDSEKGCMPVWFRIQKIIVFNSVPFLGAETEPAYICIPARNLS